MYLAYFNQLSVFWLAFRIYLVLRYCGLFLELNFGSSKQLVSESKTRGHALKRISSLVKLILTHTFTIGSLEFLYAPVSNSSAG